MPKMPGLGGRSPVRGPGLVILAVAVIVLLVGAMAVAATLHLLPASGQSANYLVPGPEGVDAGFQGFQVGTGSVAMASSLDPMPGYAWINNDPKNAVVERVGSACDWATEGYIYGGCQFGWLYKNDYGEVLSEVQRPALTLGDSPFQLPANNTISYSKYVQTAPNKVQVEKVVATLVPVDFILQLSSVPGKGYYTFNDASGWFYLNTVSWYNAFSGGAVPQDPTTVTNSSFSLLSAQYKGAFPIIAWIEGYNGGLTFTKPDGSVCNPPSCIPPSGITAFDQVTPSLAGRFISLYTSPSSVYSNYFASCAGQTSCSGVSSSQFISQMLQPGGLPDPRFAQTVFFKTSLDSFGPYVDCTGVLGTCASHDDYYPAVEYRIRVVYAFYGDFTYLWTTQTASQVGYHYSGPNATWQVRQTQLVQTVDPVTAAWNGFSSWAANALGLPSFIAGWFVLALGLVFVAAVVLVVFIAVSKRLGVSRKDVDRWTARKPGKR